MRLVAVALGGALGALARYALEGLIAPRQRGPFPLSTLVVNVSGSAALGILAGAAGPGGVPPLLGAGFLGAFTTFSTFTYETVRLLEDGAWRQAAWNLALSGPLAFAAAGAGFLLAR
ncbi:MAG TPA: CrcB family protein [Actinomycetota bacterium]|nr:CrcB family protein [Actinomycetota bacterium]